MHFSFSALVLVVLACLSIPAFISCIVMTRQKRAKILETFGKFSGIRHAGLALKLPWPIQQVVDEVDLRITELAETIEVKSKDNAFLAVPVKVQLKIMTSRIQYAYYSLDNPRQQILSYIVNQVRAKASSMIMDDIFSGKDAFETAVEEELKETFNQYGYEVVNVLVDDPQPSEELKIAFEKVISAQRDKEAARLEREAIRERKVGAAEAEAESLRIKAKAYSDQRTEMAKGNSEAIKSFCDGLEISHEQALHFFEGWDVRDAVREAAQGQGNTVLIPVQMSNELAQFAGKMEALKK